MWELCCCSTSTHTLTAACSTRCYSVCTFASVASCLSSPSHLASAAVGICYLTLQIWGCGVVCPFENYSQCYWPSQSQLSKVPLLLLSLPQNMGGGGNRCGGVLTPVLPRATKLWPPTSLYHQLLYHVSDLLCTVQPSPRDK